MIAEITSALSTNPLLTVGVGGVAVAAAARVLRSAPQIAGTFVLTACTTSVTLTSRYSLYDDVVAYLGQFTLPWSARTLAPVHGGRLLGTGYGPGFARYEGTLIYYVRDVDAGQNGYQNETLKLRFLTRDRSVPMRFVREAARTDEMRNIRVKIIDGELGCERVVSKPKRSLASVHADVAVKDRLVATFKSFLSGEEEYRALGIPYRLCAVLHGPPGTGKTSLIHALASEFDLSIVYASSLDGIGRVAGRCGPDDLLVIEDIDSMANGLDRTAPGARVETTTDGKAPLHALLNALDGFCTPHGLKVAVTTNHIDRLDPALLRPGRADLLIEVGPLQDAAIREMFAAHYGSEAATQLSERRLQPATGAHLQQLFGAHADAVSAAAALNHHPLALGLVRERRP